MTRREQTTAIKKRLLESGYPAVSVKHGTGTARSWLHIKLDVDWLTLTTIMGRVETLVAQVSNREDWHENYIIITN